ncbi:MAG: cell wall hydrolase [FCB group bacterium]|nr:cell wall hydrolase [FCB group bacterium]
MNPVDRQFFLSLSEPEILTRMGWGEARGEPLEGQVACMCVPINRRDQPKRYGYTLHNVLIEEKQFSCFNSFDPNYPYLKTFGRPKLDRDFRLQTRLRTVARLILDGLILDPTKKEHSFGATHYHAKSVTPYWASANNMVYLYEIGRHRFYREI